MLAEKNKDHCGVTNYTNLKVWIQQNRPKLGLGDSSLSMDGSKKKQKHINLASTDDKFNTVCVSSTLGKQPSS